MYVVSLKELENENDFVGIILAKVFTHTKKTSSAIVFDKNFIKYYKEPVSRNRHTRKINGPLLDHEFYRVSGPTTPCYLPARTFDSWRSPG